MSRRNRILFILIVAAVLTILTIGPRSFEPEPTPPRPPTLSEIDSMLERESHTERCIELDAASIELLRRISVRWDPLIENGMTFLDVRHASSVGGWEGPVGEMLAAVRNFFRSKSSKRQLESMFQIFLAFGGLEPGDYPLGPNDVRAVDHLNGHGLQLQPKSEFHLTTEHLKLLAHARGEWYESFSALAINPKRPYGDMTYFELDMADILGIPLAKDSAGKPEISKEQQAEFDRLFADLPFSLGVFLKNARLEPGRFCQQPAGWGAWRRSEGG